jgi:hypothetical protein
MKKSSIRTALVATSAYVALCVVLYAVASLLSANSPDANIGAGLLAVVPALPWLFFVGDSASDVTLFGCYAFNALLVFVVSLSVSRKK